MRSLGPMPANRYLSRPDIVRSGASRRRHALPRLALLRPDRSIDLHHQPVRLALGRLERGLQRSLRGWPVGNRERGRLRRAFNDFRRLTGSRREHGLDELDGLLDLLVAHSLEAPRMFNFHIPRAQQCQQLAVSCRLSLAHLGDCRWTAVPEVSEQGCNKLAVQLLTVTRADRTAGRVSASMAATAI